MRDALRQHLNRHNPKLTSPKVFTNPLVVKNHILKVLPDTVIVGATITATHTRTGFINGALNRTLIEVMTTSFLIMSYVIGSTHIPFYCS